MSKEMDRILHLPTDFRRPEDLERMRPIVEEYTARLRQKKGKWSLFAVQALALSVIEENRGLVASIAVGGGKTLISSLAPKVLKIRPWKTVLFTRAKLIAPWHREQKKYAEHFRVERDMYVYSYAKLSHPDQGPRMLDSVRPDLIIADEAHALRNPDSSRRARFERYFEDHPDTAFIAMSGTLTKTSIRDYEHLAEIALGEGTPLPRAKQAWSLLEAWAACLDPTTHGSHAKGWQWSMFQPVNSVYGDGRELAQIPDLEGRYEQARRAFYHRLRSTPGVVHTALDSCGASIEFDALTTPRPPAAVRKALSRAKDEFILPNGDEIEDPLHKSRAVRQLAQGVYYVWDWPGDPDFDWLDTRRAKAREIRTAIKSGPRHIDSPALVERAVARARYDGPDPDKIRAASAAQEEISRFDNHAELLRALDDWAPHAHKDAPPTIPIWMSEYLIDDAVNRAKGTRSRPPALIWYEHRYVAEKLEEKGIDVYWPEDGRNPEEADADDGPIALSISSHTDGLNMQYIWSRMLVLCPPSDGGTWEQMIGRIHREGQDADTVYVDCYAHTKTYRNALLTALERAKFIREANGQAQKLLSADWIKEIE